MKGMDLRDWRRVKESPDKEGPTGIHNHSWIIELSREDYLRYVDMGMLENLWEDEIKEGIPLPDKITVFRNMHNWEDMTDLVEDTIWFNAFVEGVKKIVEGYNMLFGGESNEPRS